MKLDTDDLATIIAYAASGARRRNAGAILILPLAKLREMHMENSIEIASKALARIQYDSLYGH